MIAAFLAMAASAPVPPSPYWYWRNCVHSYARKWAKRPEAADLLVEAALGSCQPLKRNVLRAEISRTPYASDLAAENVDALEADLKQEVVGLVFRLRAGGKR
jgi:hypothetical protein